MQAGSGHFVAITAKLMQQLQTGELPLLTSGVASGLFVRTAVLEREPQDLVFAFA